MNKTAVITIYVFFVLIYVTWSAKSLSLPGKPPKEKSTNETVLACRKSRALLMKRSVEEITPCSHTKLNFKSGKERAAKFHCILRCVAETLQMVTPEGLLTKETVESFVIREIPEAAREATLSALLGCYEKSVGKVDPKEENCKSYKPFIKCFLDILPTVCEEPEEPAKSNTKSKSSHT